MMKRCLSGLLVAALVLSMVMTVMSIECTKTEIKCGYRTGNTLRYTYTSSNCAVKSSIASDNAETGKTRLVFDFPSGQKCCWEVTGGLECYQMAWDAKSEQEPATKQKALTTISSSVPVVQKDLTGTYTECVDQCFGFEQEYGVEAGAIYNGKFVPVFEKDVLFAKWSLLDTIDNSHAEKPCEAKGGSDVLDAASDHAVKCAFETNGVSPANFHGNIEMKSLKLGTIEAYNDFMTVRNERVKFYDDQLKKTKKKAVVFNGQVPNRASKQVKWEDAPKVTGTWVVVSTKDWINPTVAQFTFGAQLSKLGNKFYSWSGLTQFSHKDITDPVWVNFITIAKKFYTIAYSKDWYKTSVLGMLKAGKAQEGTHKNRLNPRFHFTIPALAECVKTKHGKTLDDIAGDMLTKITNDREEQAYWKLVAKGAAAAADIPAYDDEVRAFDPSTGIASQCIVVFEKNGVPASDFLSLEPMLTEVGFTLSK